MASGGQGRERRRVNGGDYAAKVTGDALLNGVRSNGLRPEIAKLSGVRLVMCDDTNKDRRYRTNSTRGYAGVGLLHDHERQLAGLAAQGGTR